LKQTDAHLSEAAQDLGCTPFQAFYKVVLPAIMPGIISGLMMAFTLSIDDFIISYFVSGTSSQTLPIRIFSMTKRRVTPDMYALSTLIFVAILVLLVVSNIISARGDKKLSKEKGGAKK
jgi:spermidine/putrescine transport system permease protein